MCALASLRGTGVGGQAHGLGGLSCWGSLTEGRALTDSPTLSVHQNTQTTTRKKHLRSENMSEILRATKSPSLLIPTAAWRPHHTLWSGDGFRTDPTEQQDGCPLAGANTTPEKAKGWLRQQDQKWELPTVRTQLGSALGHGTAHPQELTYLS